MRKVFSLSVIGLAVIVGLWAVWPAVSPAASAPKFIPIGSAVSLTGVFGGGGRQCKAGYELAVADINAKGGVYVKQYRKRIPLKLIVLDDESNFTTTVQRMETLKSRYKVVAYLGGFSSPIHAAQAPIAEKNRTPLLMVASYLWKAHQMGFKYNFSPFPKSPDCAKTVFDVLDSIPKKIRPKKVAIIMEKAPVGMELSKLWTAQAKKRGYQVVVFRWHARGTKDFSPMILAAKKAGAEVLLTGPTPPEGMALTKQMVELGYLPKFYFAYRAPDPIAWGKALGKIGDYVCLGPGWNHGLKAPGVAHLNKVHQKKYGRPADVMVGPAYACVQILANAIERAGSLDPTKIRKAIARTKMMTVLGSTSFRPNGMGRVVFYVVQWQKGKQVLVWPKKAATAKLVYPMPAWNKR
ncbi:MAG: amino acid ABC transporter substrate-binding protein [Proteobacteria bacterium]|nr:amino acid ABC transporter substrate-binding protein [Pseudomonadota bacterium]